VSAEAVIYFQPFFLNAPKPALANSFRPLTLTGTYSISYLCETPFIRGKFNPNASDKLGVPPQRRSELVHGKAITLENGTVVSPDQVSMLHLLVEFLRI
jgi:hypothetical protein